MKKKIHKTRLFLLIGVFIITLSCIGFMKIVVANTTNNVAENTENVNKSVVSYTIEIEMINRIKMLEEELEFKSKQLAEKEEVILNLETELHKEFKPIYDVDLDLDIRELIYKKCEEYGINYKTALALAQAESSLNPKKINTSNTNGTIDYGLFQINTCNLKEIIMIPEINVIAGLYLFKQHLDYRDNNEVLALMSYNKGRRGAQELIDKGVTSNYYTDKVMEQKENILKIN